MPPLMQRMSGRWPKTSSLVMIRPSWGMGRWVLRQMAAAEYMKGIFGGIADPLVPGIGEECLFVLPGGHPECMQTDHRRTPLPEQFFRLCR